MRAFITGANGFIGSRLAGILIQLGHRVTCLVRDPSKSGDLQRIGAAVVKGDVTEKDSTWCSTWQDGITHSGRLRRRRNRSFREVLNSRQAGRP